MHRTQSCSALTRAADEPLAGTAPRARTWIAWEYAGPWGRIALESERLDEDVRHGLLTLARTPGITVVLVRRPPSFTCITEPTVLVAHAAGDRPCGFLAPQPSAAELGRWDAEALSNGALPDGPDHRELDGPELLVCTHSSRDACCAIEGRHLLTTLRDRGVAAWETSHLGGHRFAPTALVLPEGTVYGRLDPDSACSLLHEGLIDLDHVRGRSVLSPSEQVAEIAVRRETGERRPRVLTAAERRDGEVTVSHLDGRRWLVMLNTVTGRHARPESCGGESTLATSWHCTSVTPS